MRLPIVKLMARLGMIRVTALMTVLSAFMSLCVAWLMSFIFPSGDLETHLRWAFIIPFFVTPGFSYLTALSLRESRLARKAATEMARRDPLTGIANRRAFFEADAERCASASTGAERAMLFIDIDHFKLINDTFGHEAGDAVLVQLAGVLVASTRTDDVVARLGGEEFVAVLHARDVVGAQALAMRILDAVRHSVVALETKTIRYTVSIGVSVGPTSLPTTRLLAQADQALYHAKSEGRDTFCLAQDLSPMPIRPDRPRIVRVA